MLSSAACLHPATASPESESAFGDILGWRAGRKSGNGQGGGVLVLGFVTTDEDGEDEMGRRSLRGERSIVVSNSDGVVNVEVEELAIRDLVRTAPGDRTMFDARGGAGAGWVLAVKIAGAAAAMGCGLKDVAKVASLVGGNVGTVSTTSDTYGPDPIDEEVPGPLLGGVVGQMLGRLLKPNEMGMVPLRVNSNEPVLLVNVWGGYIRSEVALLVSYIVAQLHAGYGIRPVRVYAGEYLPAADGKEEEDEEKKKGFSISILNVVNTEIGGPSMIQLLDAPTRAPGWAVGVTKEEWEGREWSVEGTVDFGMKNWDGRGEWLRGARVEGNEKTKKEPEGVGVGSIRTFDQEVGEEGVLSEIGQQYVKTAESMDTREDRDRAEEEKEEEEDGSEPEPTPERPGQEAKDKADSSDMDSSKFEEASMGETNKAGGTNEADANVVENERNEALNREIGNNKKNAKTVENLDDGGRKMSSEEDFEVIDREHSLIDMVFGHGKRK
jgi:hypothetical protein